MEAVVLFRDRLAIEILQSKINDDKDVRKFCKTRVREKIQITPVARGFMPGYEQLMSRYAISTF